MLRSGVYETCFDTMTRFNNGGVNNLYFCVFLLHGQWSYKYKETGD